MLRPEVPTTFYFVILGNIDNFRNTGWFNKINKIEDIQNIDKKEMGSFGKETSFSGAWR